MKMAMIRMESEYLSYEPGMRSDDLSATFGWDLSADGCILDVFYALISPIIVGPIPIENLVEWVAENEKFRF